MKRLGISMIAGIAVGAALFAVTRQVVWVGAGVALGVGIGTLLSARRTRSNR